MSKSYIFGTPLGHDIYESDEDFKKYSQSFYISSRKGSWLIVDRVPDGQSVNAIYSYLRYGLIESKGRPNSYFGMSLVVEGGYISDFKKIYDWFEFLFNNLIEKGLFRRNEDGTIQYSVSKFKENEAVSSWLESNIPNILSATAGSTARFDSSFTFERIGVVDKISIEETPETISDRFKQYSIIALSKQFKKRSAEMTDSDSVELNLYSLEKNYHSLNEDVLHLAVNKTTSAKSQLETYWRNIDNAARSIVVYVKSGELSEEEMQKFSVLREKYVTLANTVDTLIKSIPVSGPQKPDKPRNPLEDEPETFKRCSTCRKVLPISSFDKGCSECRECHKKTLARDRLIGNIKRYGWILALVIAVPVIFFVIKNHNGDEKKETNGPVTKEVQGKVQEKPDMNKVDEANFSNLIAASNLKGAYREIKGKDNESAYIGQLNDAVSDHIWGIIQSASSENVDDKIEWDFSTNTEVYTALGIKEQDWRNTAKKYNDVTKVISSLEITRSQKEACLKDISSFPAEIAKTLKETLDLRKVKPETPPNYGKQVQSTQTSAKNSDIVTIRIYAKDGSTLIDNSKAKDYNANDNQKLGIDVNKGEYVEIAYSNVPNLI